MQTLQETPIPPRRAMPLPVAIALAMRPRQWIKNLFLYAALLFSGKAADAHLFSVATAGFALFCLLSGAVYMMNDVSDREQDRHHPKKRLRPVASGALPVSVAVVCSVVFALFG